VRALLLDDRPLLLLLGPVVVGSKFDHILCPLVGESLKNIFGRSLNFPAHFSL